MTSMDNHIVSRYCYIYQSNIRFVLSTVNLTNHNVNNIICTII